MLEHDLRKEKGADFVFSSTEQWYANISTHWNHLEELFLKPPIPDFPGGPVAENLLAPGRHKFNPGFRGPHAVEQLSHNY